MFDRLLATIQRFAENSISIIKQLFIQSGKNASGETIGSLRSEVEIDFNVAVTIDIYGSQVFDFVNDGRTAGSKLPPQGALLNWMAIRGIPEDKEFAVRKSIAEKGIEPYPILEFSLIEIQRDFNNNISDRLLAGITGILSDAIIKGFKINQNGTL